MNKTVSQIMKFIVVGAIVVIFNLLLLYLSTDVLHIWYLASSIVAYILAVVLNFSLQKLWVFENREGLLKKQMVWYGIASLGYLLANTGLMYLLVELGNIQYLISQTVIAFVLSCINYFINRNFIFERQ